MIRTVKPDTKFLFGWILLQIVFLRAGTCSEPAADLAPPPLKNYTLEDYNLQPQNWSITQSRSGQMIFANQGGILRYDGKNWESLQLPDTSALAVTGLGGRIVAAGYKTIGFLEKTAQGDMGYRPIPGGQSLGRIYRLHHHDEKIIIQSKTGFFLLRGERLSPWLPQFSIRRVFTCKEKLFFQDQKGSLFLMDNGSPKKIASLDSDRILITWLTEIEGRGLLLATYKEGLFLLRDGSLLPFPNETNHYLRRSVIIDGTRLSTGDLALATRLGGVVILRTDGIRRWLINKESGLRSDTVYSLFEDRERNLWLGLSYGICKIELQSPFRFFSKSSAVPEMVLCSTVQNGLIFVGATNGLFAGSEHSPFQRVKDLTASVWKLENTPWGILCASSSGLFLLKSPAVKETISHQSFMELEGCPGDETIWYAASDDEVFEVIHSSGSWRLHKISSGKINRTRSLSCPGPGILWCGSEIDGLWKISRNHKNTAWVQKNYTDYEGISSPVRVFSINREPWLVSGGKLMKHEKKTDRFVPNQILDPSMGNGERSPFILSQSPSGDIWAYIDRGIECFGYRGPAAFQRRHLPFLRLPKRQVNHFHFDNDRVLIANLDSLVIYQAQPDSAVAVFPCNIESVRFGQDPAMSPESCLQKVPFKLRDMEIRLSAPFFQNETSNRFQIRLENLDSDWSPWQESPVFRLTNLPGGRFTLRARAKNVFGQHSSEARLPFSVRPPWYQTPWAYLACLLVAVLLILGAIRWRTHHLETEKKELEAIVCARTEEIRRQKDQLAIQAEELQELDQLKSRFFTNISHEFRTPLTLITGPVESLVSKIEDPVVLRTLRNIRSNADRLLDLVNQLLELARFESGQMELHRAPMDLHALMKGLFSSFESMANQKNIRLQFESGIDSLPASLDPEKTERLLINLLGNALKFTPNGGTVTLGLELQNENIEISVSDTGPGIPTDSLELIFNRFTRIEGQNGGTGSGIGLALAREIATVHGGRIWAENIPSGGSRFRVRLPWVKPDGTELRIQPERLSPLADLVPGTEESSDEPPTSAPPDRPLILLVEDNAEISRYIMGILRNEYRLIGAGDGVEGIEKARAHLPDLIISDIMMPVMDGWQLCQVLKTEMATSHIPIILLTARGNEESQVKGYELGADDYVTKPFRPTLLLTRIGNLIKIRRELQKVLRRHLLTEPQEIDVNSTDEMFLREVAEILETHYSDPLFHVEAFQQKLLMGRTTLYRKLLALTGEPPSQFLRSFRMARAAQLLEKGHGNVTEVAMAVGFNNPSYFSECFKQKYGVNPSQYLSGRNHEQNPGKT